MMWKIYFSLIIKDNFVGTFPVCLQLTSLLSGNFPCGWWIQKSLWNQMTPSTFGDLSNLHDIPHRALCNLSKHLQNLQIKKAHHDSTCKLQSDLVLTLIQKVNYLLHVNHLLWCNLWSVNDYLWRNSSWSRSLLRIVLLWTHCFLHS